MAWATQRNIRAWLIQLTGSSAQAPRILSALNGKRALSAIERAAAAVDGTVAPVQSARTGDTIAYLVDVGCQQKPTLIYDTRTRTFHIDSFADWERSQS